MQNTFVESMKTIARLAVDKAGFDKTRTGKIVAVNSVTNTYSVKVDGIIYNNVKTVNDSTYNVGDTVKVNIPMNNPSQSYIASSILSDESFGNKIAKATSAIDAVDERINGIVEIMGKIYQLSIGITYSTRTVGSGATAVTYTDATYTAILTQDGEDVTASHSASEFNWYLEKTTGKTNVGTRVKTITLSSEQYLYGQSVILEWTYDGEVKLRARVTLFNESAVQQIAKYATEITTGGVFVHRADGVYDVGANWESPNAYGVKLAESVDIIKGGEIYGSFGGTYVTLGNTSKSNIYMDSSGFIQLRNSSTVLADIRSGSITLGRTTNGYYNLYMDTQHLYFKYGADILTDITGSSITLGRTTSGNYNTYITNNGIQLRYATSNSVFRTILSLDTNGMSLYNSSNTRIASFASNNIIMGDTSNYIKITNASMDFTKTNINVGSLQYDKYKDDNNMYGLTLYLKRATTTQKPAYVGFTAQDSSDKSIFRWIYVQDNASISGYTSGALNAGANIDMNGYKILEVDTISFEDGSYINNMTGGGLYTSGTFASAGRAFIGNIDYGYAFNVSGTAYISGDTHVGQLHLYDTNEASSRTANARLTTGSIPARLCFVNSSSKRYKHDIKPINNNDIDPHLLYNIEVVQFKFNNDYLAKDDQRYGIDVPGFIAENIAEEYPIAADINDDGTVEDWNDRFLIPPMLKLIQEQKQMIDDLERRLSQLERKE